MANESKPSRTQVEDLPMNETDLTADEARKVKGGVGEGFPFKPLPAPQDSLKKIPLPPEPQLPPLRH